jgi:hypothetical protein
LVSSAIYTARKRIGVAGMLTVWHWAAINSLLKELERYLPSANEGLFFRTEGTEGSEKVLEHQYKSVSSILSASYFFRFVNGVSSPALAFLVTTVSLR